MNLIEQRGMRWLILDKNDDEYGHISRYADGTFHVYAWDGGLTQDHIGEGNCIKHALEDAAIAHAVRIPKSIRESRFYQ